MHPQDTADAGSVLGCTPDQPPSIMTGLEHRLAALGLALDAPWGAVHWEGAVADPADWVLWLTCWLSEARAVSSQAYAVDPAAWAAWQGFAFELLGVAAPDDAPAPDAPAMDWLLSAAGTVEEQVDKVVWHHPSYDPPTAAPLPPGHRLRFQVLEQRAWACSSDLVAAIRWHPQRGLTHHEDQPGDFPTRRATAQRDAHELADAARRRLLRLPLLLPAPPGPAPQSPAEVLTALLDAAEATGEAPEALKRQHVAERLCLTVDAVDERRRRAGLSSWRAFRQAYAAHLEAKLNV
jgi:hypothetical protein